MKELDVPIDRYNRILELSPYGHPNEPFVYSNLATSHLLRFERHYVGLHLVAFPRSSACCGIVEADHSGLDRER